MARCDEIKFGIFSNVKKKIHIDGAWMQWMADNHDSLKLRFRLAKLHRPKGGSPALLAHRFIQG